MKRIALTIALLAALLAAPAHADYAPIGKCSAATGSCSDRFTVTGDPAGTVWWAPMTFPKRGTRVDLYLADGRPLRVRRGRRHACRLTDGCKYRGPGVSAYVLLHRHVITVDARAPRAPLELLVLASRH